MLLRLVKSIDVAHDLDLGLGIARIKFDPANALRIKRHGEMRHKPLSLPFIIEPEVNHDRAAIADTKIELED